MLQIMNSIKKLGKYKRLNDKWDLYFKIHCVRNKVSEI